MDLGTVILQDVKERYDGNQLMVSDMTMRDHFAGLAMQACINKGYQAAADSEFIAEMAYEAADAMIQARPK